VIVAVALYAISSARVAQAVRFQLIRCGDLNGVSLQARIHDGTPADGASHRGSFGSPPAHRSLPLQVGTLSDLATLVSFPTASEARTTSRSLRTGLSGRTRNALETVPELVVPERRT
jgi:hypothetical protein